MHMDRPASTSVLWSGTVFGRPLEDRLAAARAGGFPAMSFFPADFAAATAARSEADVRALLRDSGVSVSTLDPFAKWLPTFEPPSYLSAGDVAFVGTDEADFFRMARALDAASVTVIEPFGNPVEQDAAVEHFGRFCDRAADQGLRVHLEFIPWSGIPDLATAWDIVRLADRPNGGLVFDVWHYFRGNRDDDLLASIPGDRIFTVQLSDGGAEPVRDLYYDFMHHRRAPGEGDFDLVTVLDVLRSIGGLCSTGPEIFADAFTAMTPAQAGQRAAATTAAVLREPGAAPG